MWYWAYIQRRIQILWLTNVCANKLSRLRCISVWQ
jgi:hypothetical protein